MSDPQPLPQLVFDSAPKRIADELGYPGCICLFRAADGTVSFAGHGVNNAQANEMLSIGIFINLQQHYRNVAAGDAGAEAQARHEELSKLNEVNHVVA